MAVKDTFITSLVYIRPFNISALVDKSRVSLKSYNQLLPLLLFSKKKEDIIVIPADTNKTVERIFH